jgi:hypothetical protein
VKTVSEIEKDANGFHFECVWDGELAIAIELEEACKPCPVSGTFDFPIITFNHKDPFQAVFMGSDETQMKHARSYLIEYKGWTEQGMGRALLK